MSTFRALCAELLQPLAEYDGADPYHEHRDLITRARAELAKPRPVGPTRDELRTMAAEFAARTPEEFALAVLARWGSPAIEPVPQGPTDEELRKLLYYEFTTSTGHGERVDVIGFALAVLARWGRPAVIPILVSERPWEREGWCDAQGTCWMWHPVNFHYCLCRPDPSVHTHSLPHWVLPLPTPVSERLLSLEGAILLDTGSESTLSEFSQGEMPLG